MEMTKQDQLLKKAVNLITAEAVEKILPDYNGYKNRIEPATISPQFVGNVVRIYPPNSTPYSDLQLVSRSIARRIKDYIINEYDLDLLDVFAEVYMRSSILSVIDISITNEAVAEKLGVEA